MGTSSKADRHFDALILGCGSAGTTAAKRLRADGHSVAVVEMDQPGGDCPLRACVPTKALLRSAQVYSLLKRAGSFGIEPGTIGFDWAKVMARKEDIVRQTGGGGASRSLNGRASSCSRGGLRSRRNTPSGSPVRCCVASES
jgi:pyruvate/2-oxoglutarate dehydrogenase complex dihydrolipoamide dehydrogenase (E3) component